VKLLFQCETFEIVPRDAEKPNLNQTGVSDCHSTGNASPTPLHISGDKPAHPEREDQLHDLKKRWQTTQSNAG